jgi:hypothetical protein
LQYNSHRQERDSPQAAQQTLWQDLDHLQPAYGPGSGGGQHKERLVGPNPAAPGPAADAWPARLTWQSQAADSRMEDQVEPACVS